MSYYEVYRQYKSFPFAEFLNGVTPFDVRRALQKEQKGPLDFLTLLSPAAAEPALLEEMAQKAHTLTEHNFGKTITLFTPLYLANICENACVYCGFNRTNHIGRCKLTLEEVAREGKAIRDEGIRHIIILTGESRAATPPSYIADCVRVLKQYVDSICIEVYSLEEDEYRMLFEAGVDAFTMFQETYNEDLYPKLHPSGPKHDYKKRLNSPELACRGGLPQRQPRRAFGARRLEKRDVLDRHARGVSDAEVSGHRLRRFACRASARASARAALSPRATLTTRQSSRRWWPTAAFCRGSASRSRRAKRRISATT